MTFQSIKTRAQYSSLALLLGLGGFAPQAAQAKSDACCGDIPTCFCYKAENGDWLKGGLVKLPASTQTVGLQFKPASVLQNHQKVVITKTDCNTGTAVWAGPDGKGGCTPGFPGLRK